MKAFLIGFLFLIVVFLMAVIGTLLFPLLLVLAWFLRVILAVAFVVLAIWLLGKFIIYAWEKIK